jgi:hypothetical protein
LERKQRKHFPGTNLGSFLGPVTAVPYDDPKVWRLTPAEKTKLYGADGAVFNGGACPDAVPKPCLPGEVEPASWFPTNPKLLEELVHDFDPKVILRWPEVDHMMAIQAMAAKIPIVLVAFTPHHAVLLKRRIQVMLWQCMSDPQETTLFEIGLARLVNKETPPAEDKKRKAADEPEEADGTASKARATSKKGRGRGAGARGRGGQAKGGRPAASAAAEKARQLLLNRLQGGKKSSTDEPAPSAAA